MINYTAWFFVIASFNKLKQMQATKQSCLFFSMANEMWNIKREKEGLPSKKLYIFKSLTAFSKCNIKAKESRNSRPNLLFHLWLHSFIPRHNQAKQRRRDKTCIHHPRKTYFETPPNEASMRVRRHSMFPSLTTLRQLQK